MSDPSRWAVTGAAGFLGSHVVDHLLARGTRVLALDDVFDRERGVRRARYAGNPAFT